MDTQERKQFLTQAFFERYNAQPSLWARAPGRVDTMGSHTDYNQGYVMTMTIDRDTWIAGRPRDDGQVSVYSLDVEGGGPFSLDSIEPSTSAPWTNYIRGVAKALQQAGYDLRGFDGLIHSTIPFGSGLSSSAAIEMAAAVMFQLAGDFELDPVQMALIGQRAENEFVGVPCGILDQYSSALGRAGSALLLDCRDNSNRAVPIADGINVVICDTKADRNLAGTEYEDRRRQCEEGVRIMQGSYPDILALRDVPLGQVEACADELPEVVAKRCRFIIEENQRVLDMADALPAGDMEQLGTLCAASYVGARDLYEIGVPAMQSMFDAMESGPGVIGARQAGAGFGGCMLALVREGYVDRFAQHVSGSYLAATGVQPSVYAVTPSDSAGPLT